MNGTTWGGLAKGLAGYYQGRQLADQRDYEREQQRRAEERQARLDAMEQARMDAQLQQMQWARQQADQQAAWQAADRARQQQQDAKSDFEGGYRAADQVRQQGQTLGRMSATPPFAPAGMLEAAGAMMQQHAATPVFTRDGTGYVKGAESVQETRDRQAREARQADLAGERAARATERAEDRTFTAGENAKNRAATLAGITARLAAGAAPPPLKTLPASVVGELTENGSILNTIATATSMMDQGQGSGGFGFWRGLQRSAGLDRYGAKPEDIDLAALVGNIASQQIKLRSGQAVTAAEWPRLRPFIPVLAGPGADDVKNVRRKLDRMRQIIADETEARATYYREQGYAVPGIGGAASPPAAPPAAGAVDVQDPEFQEFIRSRMGGR